MSCRKCEEKQENTNASAYYRLGTANIELRGCKEHLKKAIDILNEATTEQESEEYGADAELKKYHQE